MGILNIAQALEPDRAGSRLNCVPNTFQPTVTELLVMAGGAIPPPVLFPQRCYSALDFLLGQTFWEHVSPVSV